MKKCVVSFADGGHYLSLMKRLGQSLKDVGFDGDIRLFTDYSEIGSPTHQEVPYAFKAYSLRKVIEEGYDLILWCDSPVHATKSIDPVFEHIKQHGYLFFDNIGWTIGDYTSDACLEKQGMTREESLRKNMLMMCCYGLNTQNVEALTFADRYISASKDGVSYMGDWSNNKGQVSSHPKVQGHRHDQSVASIIVDQMKLDITRAQDTFFAYTSHNGVVPISNSVCLWSGN